MCGCGPGPPASATWERANGPDGGGGLRVVTSNVRAGYLRKNGVPYNERATVTEHFDIAPLPDVGRLLLVTTSIRGRMIAPMLPPEGWRLDAALYSPANRSSLAADRHPSATSNVRICRFLEGRTQQ
jgi:hypothetical protein